jgi:hypothetical protein
MIMNRLTTILKQASGIILALMFCAMQPALAGNGDGKNWGSATANGGTYDTGFALEYEYSCLTGGCHETNTYLVNTHQASYMTHVMVKCNACHGTHTAAEVGKVKPNLTGYTASSGVTGYKVPKDRCLVCHSSMLNTTQHPKNPSECLKCHAPHEFDKNK